VQEAPDGLTGRLTSSRFLVRHVLAPHVKLFGRARGRRGHAATSRANAASGIGSQSGRLSSSYASS
jgi:hypothetical protein